MVEPKISPENWGEDQKHDEGYKDVLSIKSCFLHFLTKYTSLTWVKKISVDDLEPVNCEFIEFDKRAINSDVIYKLKMGDTEVHFYVLLELQSRIDFTMPFRLSRYMSELQNLIFKNTDEKARTRKDYRLPAVVPIVLYNGKHKWTVAKTFREYTANHELFGDNIMDFTYLLFDLARMDEETILSTKTLLDIIFILDKRRLEGENMDEAVERFTKPMRGLPEDEQSTLAGWVTCTCRGTPNFKKTFKQFLKKGGDTMKGAWVELLEEQYGKAEGRREGRQEGWREGRQEGWRESRWDVAKSMVAGGMDVDTIVRYTGLTVDDVLRLKTEDAQKENQK